MLETTINLVDNKKKLGGARLLTFSILRYEYIVMMPQ